MARAVFLTGMPGVGKTTVLLKTVKALEQRGLKPGGMISREAREGGLRVGFELLDVQTGRTGWLSHVRNPSGPVVGKYRVNLADLDSVGVKAIEEAVTRREVCLVVIDEVGPMELFSSAFREAVRKALLSPKPLLGVL
ncbi:MAG: nucleoside-triphosphatase, partial [Candidatus Bathyarchaeia archaeon]